MRPEEPLGTDTLPSPEEALSNMDLCCILAVIANGVGYIAQENYRTYANEKALFADVLLIFAGNNVTQFLKEIEQRSDFY